MTLFVPIAAALCAAVGASLLVALALGRAAAHSDALFDRDARLLIARDTRQPRPPAAPPRSRPYPNHPDPAHARRYGVTGR